jgi:hypothetical protein
MHAIRKGQVRWVAKGDAIAQRQFIHTIFGIPDWADSVEEPRDTRRLRAIGPPPRWQSRQTAGLGFGRKAAGEPVPHRLRAPF